MTKDNYQGQVYTRSWFKPMTGLLGLLALFGLSFSLLTAPANADQSQFSARLCGGVAGSSIGDSADCKDEESEATIRKVIKNVLNIISWAAGVAALIVILIAGFRYIVQGGSGSEGVKNAKKMVIYALVGIVIVVLAQTIINFVIGTTDVGDEQITTTETSDTQTPAAEPAQTPATQPPAADPPALTANGNSNF